MCGIAGLINLSGRLHKEQLEELTKKMMGSFEYRGPNDWGVWGDPTGTCALSQCRLSIIDLSPTGHQPMVHDATGSAITFNGEIYNYRELRPALTSKGYQFKGASDTEVLLAGLVEHGADYVNALDGMFAFGHYDARTKTLTLARDIFGEKPLYCARTKDWFAFASELHALTILPGFDTRISLDSITTYLALQYLPAPSTIYQSAFKLPPAHTLQLTMDGHEVIKPYFRFKASAQKSGTRSMDDLADELESILVNTIQTRLISDVPLGAFLSGGVDSSTVVALASKLSNSPIKTFSIGFEGSADSEHLMARDMAAHLKTNHLDQVLPLDALALGRHIAEVLDEPNGDTSCLPTWILSKMTRQHVTVALSGDGGDELFGGYGRYLRTLEDAEANASNPEWNVGEAYYSPRILVFGDAAITKFIGHMPDKTASLLTSLRHQLNAPDLPILQRLRETDIQNYMPGAVLPKVDRMSMQHALEVRAPLLGRKVADFAMQMAAEDLCTASQSKKVLKHLAARYIPRTWLDRPKMGFGLPLQGWGGQELAQAVEELLTDGSCCLNKWIDSDAIHRFLNYHRQTPGTYQLWEVFILELWLRSHLHHAA